MEMITSHKFAFRSAMILLLLSAAIFPGAITFAASTQKTFPTPQDAADAYLAACAAQDAAALGEILGPGGDELIHSGDDAQDQRRRERFATLAKESMEVKTDPADLERYVIYVGPRGWPLPIPIVKTKDAYRFDTAAGKDEILARRVGRNELDAIAFLRSFVQAQIDYAYSDANGNGMRDYAQTLVSHPGQRDGLYWEPKEGEAPSSVDDFVQTAVAEGYTVPEPGEPFDYHGYRFRLLTQQGKNAPGGARDYIVRGDMIGGFAMIATPLEYGSSGVKTFLVNQDGVVWEKDLGAKTKSYSAGTKAYDPDKTWMESPKEEEEAAAPGQ
jgi:hypothetical protein